MIYCKFSKESLVFRALLLSSVQFQVLREAIEAAVRIIQELHIHFSASGIFRFQVIWIKGEIRHLPTIVLSVYADFYRRTETGLYCTDQVTAYPELLQQDRLYLFSYRYILSLCRPFSYQ